MVAELRAMKLKEAAKKVEDGIEETLTYCDFPSEHWTRIRTNNVIERLNREIRRRTRVVGTFPDGNSALMLVCARLRHVAEIITDTYKAGNQVVAVLSAQGDTTDELIEKANEINPLASNREMDMLLSTGEQMSVALCAMAIEALGYPVISLTGWQAGMVTNTVSRNARIKKVDTERIETELNQKKIVIVTGFQGINRYEDITTLGRGGSDTSAVALAASLRADLCQIYTDVDGVYTADPRIVKDAGKLDEVTYNEMLELATLGAQVLHNRSVEMAKKYNVKLEVLSSFTGHPGTKVKEVAKRMEKSYISSVAKNVNIARIALIGVPNEIGTSFKVFSLLAQNHINVDIILQGIGIGSSSYFPCFFVCLVIWQNCRTSCSSSVSCT